MITAHHLSKKFGSTRAVNDLSFQIGTGEIVGLLGPNGAGKTTTMRILAGILEPDQGTVEIGGLSPFAYPERAKALLGYLPENNALEEELQVWEYLRFIARIRRVSQPGERMRQIARKTGIAEVFYKPIAELSKGYRQRVGLAATILADPKVLILDEPTEGLDPNQRTEIRSLIQELAKDRTIILSTHVLREVERIATRLIIIKDGALVGDGSLEELQEKFSSKTLVSCQIEGADVAQSLRRLPGVRDVREERDPRGRMRILVHGNADGRQLAASIFRCAKERDWTLWELREERSGIEEIFRELTTST